MSLEQPDLRPEAEIRPPYQAFLLRCWQEATDGEPSWRFTLVHLVDRRMVRGFASLKDVTVYLQQVLANTLPPGEPSASRGRPDE